MTTQVVIEESMGLFDKKYCDICGKEIKFLGNKKLDDGNCCKDCASKLSPWFTGRRRSTVEDIKKQLKYREQNSVILNTFVAGESVCGEIYTVTFDQSKEHFVVYGGRDFRKVNADMLSVKDVSNVTVTVKDNKKEEKQKDEEGKEVSYNPPKYTYNYTFYVKMEIKHDYIDEIGFELADNIDSKTNDKYKEACDKANTLMQVMTGKTFTDPFEGVEEEGTETEPTLEAGQWKCPECGAVNSTNFCTSCGHEKPATVRYCGQCGAKVTDGTAKFCPACGSKLI
ncbi:MAG: DUF4428 domain-containing protein [Erysipelotrichaceae bacterium]|nr:DUF4428 domain-containing protein [Erysipelotrichaceae bacterium]